MLDVKERKIIAKMFIIESDIINYDNGVSRWGMSMSGPLSDGKQNQRSRDDSDDSLSHSCT